jgi:hypothetical protein
METDHRWPKGIALASGYLFDPYGRGTCGIRIAGEALMLDRLRDQFRTGQSGMAVRSTRRAGRTFLGLTPSQLFVLALMLFLNVAVLGCFALIAFEKIYLPF